jgi:hypothetical protein
MRRRRKSNRADRCDHLEEETRKMAVHMIRNYVLRYDLDHDRPWIIFHYQVSGQWHNVNWLPPREDAVYLADMLRNEKPVYYVDSGGRKWITTAAEQIGEEES